jgi:hypothetical protein
MFAQSPDGLPCTGFAGLEQELPCSEWELLLIDNDSQIPLAGTCDLSWHPHAQCIVETEVGLTSARLRAIREAQSEILVFVNDDNVLEHDYLWSARGSAKISRT